MTPPLNHVENEMHWECIRRHPDYPTACKRFIHSKSVLQSSINPTPIPTPIICEDSQKVMSEFLLVWGILHPIDSNKPFSKLSRRERSWFTLHFPANSVRLHSSQINEELRSNVFFSVLMQHKRLLPGKFDLIVIPVTKQPNARGKIPRKRADIHQFRKELLAWDMRMAGYKWITIGKKLGLTLAKTDAAERDRLLVTSARNYHKSADRKIMNSKRV